ncbi:unnamed protein product, partial [Owenia fusiformis]
PDAACPDGCSGLIDLLSAVEAWQQKHGNKPITVHCMNGADRSGLFCLASTAVESIKLEQEVDLFQIAKSLKTTRPQLLPTKEQYIFCHDVVENYMSSFDTYANFQ